MKKTVALLLLIWLVFPARIGATQTTSVGVAPFSIHSQEDLGYLSQGIPDMISGHLLQRGIRSMTPNEVQQAMNKMGVNQLDQASAVKLGRALGVNYIIFGSLTKVGQQASLDAKVVDVSGSKSMVSVFGQAPNLEGLNVATEKLAQEIIGGVSGTDRIAGIEISGNQRIETEAIKRGLQSKEGDIFIEQTLSGDLKRVYEMGFFDDVQVDVEDAPGGKIVRIMVKEKPTIQEIVIKGNRMIDEEDLRAVLGYSQFSIVNPQKIVESVDQMKGVYRGKGYFNAQITYAITPMDDKSVTVQYDIDEGSKVYVRKIIFDGNEEFSSWKLRRKMETKQKNILSWAMGTGILETEVLKTDVKRLTAWYFKNGYLDAKVAEPEISVGEDGLTIRIAIHEGPQYRAGSIQITGDLVVPEEEYLEALKIEPGDVLDRQLVQEDVQTVTSLTADHGYAFADVNPDLSPNPSNPRQLDINYVITKKSLVYFERISIAGNDKTRDKVIRRYLKVKEGKLFSAKDLEISQLNLNRLDYFEEVQIVQSQGSGPDKMDLAVEVKEKPTGSFSIGAGYSSFNKLFGTISVAERNLFGTGKRVEIEATMGEATDQYVFSFTEPWLFDMPLSAGFDVFYRTIDYDTYDKDGRGFYLRAGYPFGDFFRLSSRYRFEWINITDVAEDAPETVKEIAGQSVTSSVTVVGEWDSRNKVFNPTKGNDTWVSVEYAGLGGDNAFTKYIAESGWYFENPLFDESAFFLRGKIGYVTQNPQGKLPDYEKFILGGINSIRGYSYGDVSPKDPVTGDYIGGEKMLQINAEFTFPILKNYGIIGVVFLDQANSWSEDQEYSLDDLKRSYGGGVRWNSPMGLLRLEYGQVIDPEEGDPSGQWEFAVGGAF